MAVHTAVLFHSNSDSQHPAGHSSTAHAHTHARPPHAHQQQSARGQLPKEALLSARNRTSDSLALIESPLSQPVNESPAASLQCGKRHGVHRVARLPRPTPPHPPKTHTPVTSSQCSPVMITGSASQHAYIHNTHFPTPPSTYIQPAGTTSAIPPACDSTSLPAGSSHCSCFTAATGVPVTGHQPSTCELPQSSPSHCSPLASSPGQPPPYAQLREQTAPC
jgi:hypothetical protein